MGSRLKQMGRRSLVFSKMQCLLVYYRGGQKNSGAEGSLDILNSKIIRLTEVDADFS